MAATQSVCWIHQCKMEQSYVLRGFWGLLLAAICFIDERAIAFPAWESKGYISIVAENLIDKQLLADKLGETESQKYDLLVCICYFEMNLYT